mmetsp:Transcript_9072/g.29807  ORF Transcript_9072/g.29807 Transcript_9072/m.29807 type:complete len:336 (-) Transcript_9072:344-1351(-)
MSTKRSVPVESCVWMTGLKYEGRTRESNVEASVPAAKTARRHAGVSFAPPWPSRSSRRSASPSGTRSAENAGQNRSKSQSHSPMIDTIALASKRLLFAPCPSVPPVQCAASPKSTALPGEWWYGRQHTTRALETRCFTKSSHASTGGRPKAGNAASIASATASGEAPASAGGSAVPSRQLTSEHERPFGAGITKRPKPYAGDCIACTAPSKLGGSGAWSTFQAPLTGSSAVIVTGASFAATIAPRTIDPAPSAPMSKSYCTGASTPAKVTSRRSRSTLVAGASKWHDTEPCVGDSTPETSSSRRAQQMAVRLISRLPSPSLEAPLRRLRRSFSFK